MALEDKILFDPNWEKLNAQAELVKAEQNIDFVSAIKKVAEEKPDLVVNQDLLDRALVLIAKEDLSIMDAMKLIQEQERVALTHTKTENIEKHTKESLDLDKLTKARAKEKGISYTDAYREVADENKELVGVVEKYVIENADVKAKVLAYQESHPESKMNFTEVWLHLENLKEAGLDFKPKG